jgi:hypothetical protein
MGLFDWFKGKEAAVEPEAQAAPAAAPAERRFGFERERMFDIARTHQLAQLFAMPREQRGAEWVAAFYDAAWFGSIELTEPQVFAGPDGFPYLRLNLPRPDTAFDSQCLANLAPNCLEHGVGAAFFASPDDGPEAAHFVLSLGHVDSLVRYDSPDGDPIDIAESEGGSDEGAFDVERGLWSQTLVAKEPQEVLVGTPSAEFLPPHVAAALLRHLEEGWGLADPRVQLLVNAKMKPRRSLVIGRKRSEFPEGAPVDDMARALLWFLTPSRSIILAPEEWDLTQMTPLRELAAASRL